MGQECLAMGISMRLITESDAKYEKVKLERTETLFHRIY